MKVTGSMKTDHQKLEKLLCDQLCRTVRLHQRDDSVLMLDVPFVFPDGDHFPVYVTESETGCVRLSDQGHTMMHISYDHDVDSFYQGAKAMLREQVVQEFGIIDEEGVFSIETTHDHLASALFTLGQALTRIYDLAFLNHDRGSSTFYRDLEQALTTIVGEDSIESDFIITGISNADKYPVDYRIKRPENDTHLFLFGVSGQDKARLTTIVLSYFLRQNLDFDSIVVYADMGSIPRSDLARLTDVSGTAVSSLDAQSDLQRKIENLVA